MSPLFSVAGVVHPFDLDSPSSINYSAQVVVSVYYLLNRLSFPPAVDWLVLLSALAFGYFSILFRRTPLRGRKSLLSKSSIWQEKRRPTIRE
jgi:hypothetical protein